MTQLEIWILAVTLAIDCLTVSMASGTAMKKVDLRPVFVMALMFGLFQAGMPLLGWSGTELLSETIERFDHWIAFALLAGIGAKMIKESFDEEKESGFDISSMKVVLLLSIATSIDALAVGVTFTCVGMHSLKDVALPVAEIGLVSFLFGVAGTYIGAHLRHKTKFPMERIGGLVLIALGCKILMEHTTNWL